jgi:hypothetical protein
VQRSAIPPGPDQLIRNQEFDSAITALRHLLEVVSGAEGISDMEHVAIGNGAFGGSDIEGKAAMGSGE